MRLQTKFRIAAFAAILFTSCGTGASCGPNLAPRRRPTVEDILDAKNALATLELHLALTMNPVIRDRIASDVLAIQRFIRNAETISSGELPQGEDIRELTDIHAAVRRATGTYLTEPDRPAGGYRREIDLFYRDTYRR